MAKVLIITGLTASGKSSLALNIAQKYNGEIISCDSVQVYRGFDIGSAKENAENMKIVKHHLIDIVDASYDYSVGDFLKDSKKAVEECITRGKLPIIVGGTGMYIKALLEGYTLGSHKNQEFRDYWLEIAKNKGKLAVWEELNKRNSSLADKVHYNNLNRVIRYLEIDQFGEAKKEDSFLKNYDVLAIGINIEKDEIYPKINKRVDEMISLGFEQEVRNLINQGVNPESNAMKSIGYREMYKYISNEITFEECVDKIKQHTRNYAKRQLTFMKTIQSLQLLNLNEASRLISNFLQGETND